MADDAVGLMDALRVERAHIVGASMGGMIAQIVAIHHPDRVKSLVSIMSTTGRRDLPPGNPETLSALFRPPNSESRDDLIEASVLVQKALASPGFPTSETEMRLRAERRTDRAPFDLAGLARQSAALIVAPPRNALLNQVRCPTLVLHGADDPVIPAAAAEDTAKSIPGAELVIIPGGSHDFPPGLVPVYLKHIGEFRLEGGGALRLARASRFLPIVGDRTIGYASPSGRARMGAGSFRQHRNQRDDKPGEDR